MINGRPKPAAIDGSAAGWPNESGQYSTGGGVRAEATQRATAGQQISNERFAARNQLVGENEPRAGLETFLAQQLRQRRGAVRTHGEIVVEDDRLPVEQKTLIGARRIVDQLVDERDEPLPKAFGRVIPLAIPVGVGDDVDV